MQYTRLAFFSFLLFCLHQCPLAQEQPRTKSRKAIDAYNEGLKSYTQRQYKAAESLLRNAIEADPQFIDAYLVLAEVYEDSGQPQQAISVYRKGLPIQQNFYPYGYVRLGNLEYREGQYAQALESYNQYLLLNTGHTGQIERAREGISRSEFALDALTHPVDFQPQNLGPAVNTPSDEYWPSLSADEQTLVITRLVSSDEFMRKVQEDFFISQRGDSGWTTMKNAGRPLNTGDNEGAQTLSGDGRIMVFTACNRNDGVGRCDLYYTVKTGDLWAIPRNLGKPVNTPYRETQPSLSADGRTLYFSSDRPGGKGQHDLWVSRMNDRGQWSEPENLGEPVNTRGVEMSPFIHPDNQSLYFSSDGHLGMGGYDLFVARKDSAGAWQQVRNLGYPINTHRDEIGLIVNAQGDKAYYASDVDKKNGKDIFVFDMPLENRPVIVTYMKGKVFDAENRQALKAQFELVDLETGQNLFRSFSDSLSGEFLVSIPLNRNYMLNVSRADYLFFSENFSLKYTYEANRPYLKDVPLQPIKAGNRIVLRNIFFETDSYALRKESTAELNKLLRFLQLNPAVNIEISGHTDNTGNPEYNQKLSENRAKSVTDYLIRADVHPQRIISRGYGLTRPMAPNDTEEGRALNRRTEMQIIE